MSEVIDKFIEIIKSRSRENTDSINILFKNQKIGNCISIIRQELDSFIRVIYLGKIENMDERKRLMGLTIFGRNWDKLTINGRMRKITDRDMVDFSNELFGYIKYVYKFECGFIHLSKHHNFSNENPFNSLNSFDKNSILQYLAQYHEYPIDNELNIENFKPYTIKVYDKISRNMSHHLDELREERVLEF